MEHVQRLVALGLKRATAVKLVSLVDLWTRSSGPEWTVSRLKQIKLAILDYRAGRPLRLNWIKSNKLGIPSGPLAELFRLAIRDDRGLFIAVNSTMIYSKFVNDYITETQRKKFFGSMESEDVKGISSVSTGMHKYPPCKWRIASGTPWTNALLSSSVFQPGLDGKSYPETDTVESLKYAACSVPITQIIHDSRLLFNEVVPVKLLVEVSKAHFAALRKKTRALPIISDALLAVGKISYIQEPGLKLRAVANPNRVIQHALQPLKAVLGEVLRAVPNDSTFDQESGVQWVQRELSEGKTVYSIDLSDATNLFPLSYTEDVLLRRLSIAEIDRPRYEELVKVFVRTSKSRWFSKENGVVNLHKFTRGQPLGLGPSFFAFSLSHHTLVRDLCRDLGLSKPYPYRILGDDICISNDILASAYMEKVESIGCKIALEKSMISSSIAEFGGKIITVERIIPQFKWRDINDQNFLDFSKNLGQKSLALLSKRQREVIELLAEVPDFLGGMGWNPKGLSLEERFELPMSKFLLLKGNPEVFLPHQRVDRPLKKFMLNFNIDREKNASIDSRNDYLRNAINDVALIPARDSEARVWGTLSWWKRFHMADSSSHPFDVHISIDSVPPNFDVVRLYQPVYRLIGVFDKVNATPWFDVIRLFQRNQSPD